MRANDRPAWPNYGVVRRGTVLDSARSQPTGSAEDLIRAHYEDFNERRVEAAAARFHPDARLEHVTGRLERGPDAYREFAGRWLTAFPDSRLRVERIRRRGPGLYDVDLIAVGTHLGTLTFASWIFRATGVRVRLPARELIQIEDGQFQFASLCFDLQDLVRQLASIDVTTLLQHLRRIQQLGEQLTAANPARQRELLERLGQQLDEARHVVRPYFR
jgi:predicted ester cyclase